MVTLYIILGLLFIANMIVSVVFTMQFVFNKRAKEWEQRKLVEASKKKEREFTQILIAQYLSIAPFLRGDKATYYDSNFKKCNELSTMLAMRLTPDLYKSLHKLLAGNPVKLGDVECARELAINTYGKFEYKMTDLTTWFPPQAEVKKEGKQ